MNAIMTRASIYEIEAHRNRALALYGEAFDKLMAAHDAAHEAAPRGVYELPALKFSSEWPTRSREEFVARCRAAVDRGAWSYVVDACGITTLWDQSASEQFRAQLAADPPDATAENIEATVFQLIADRELIFKRGVATAFARLDRRFRSHDGFKVGSRLVLSAMFGVDGFRNYHRAHDETLVDVERAMYLLDGKRQPERHAGIYGAVIAAKEAAGLRCLAGTFTAEDEYFRVRVFKNGNAHLWFKRGDLVEKVNHLLADYYGANLGVGPDAASKHSAPEPSRAMAKNYGFFESPEAVAAQVLSEARLVPVGAHSKALRILEPSAGRGALARPMAQMGHLVTCVEIQGQHAEELRQGGHYEKVVCGDFLDQSPAVLGQFDLVVMNPPFDRGLDVDHVNHALRFLAPGGRLVSVMSAGTEFREDRRTTAFRAHILERLRGRFYDLPAGSFASAGTMVNTCILTVRVPQ